MAITTGRPMFPIRSAGDGLSPTTAFHVHRPVMSTTVLADTVDAVLLLERRLSARGCERSESAVAALGRLEVWAHARPWEVDPQLVEKADRILRTAEQAYSTISAACWIESLPDEIFDLLDRRRSSPHAEASGAPEAGGSPHRRATDA